MVGCWPGMSEALGFIPNATKINKYWAKILSRVTQRTEVRISANIVNLFLFYRQASKGPERTSWSFLGSRISGLHLKREGGLH